MEGVEVPARELPFATVRNGSKPCRCDDRELAPTQLSGGDCSAVMTCVRGAVRAGENVLAAMYARLGAIQSGRHSGKDSALER
jgi:hypothetical protein